MSLRGHGAQLIFFATLIKFLLRKKVFFVTLIKFLLRKKDFFARTNEPSRPSHPVEDFLSLSRTLWKKIKI